MVRYGVATTERSDEREFMLTLVKKLSLEIDAGEYMMYTRAYYWIQSCKVRNKEWKIALSNYASDEFLVAVKLSINYFESTEEYEKCAFLKKIQDFIEKCLAK